MPNDFLNISEATLWDNLKRKSNETLRKLEGIENKFDLLKEFDPELYPVKIQKLLEDIGKSFFKIFLYEALRNKFTNDDFENASEGLKDFIRSFKFYFWPGFTTLNKKRIHIQGSKKVENSDDRFFTGIGNTLIDEVDLSFLPQYFNDYSPKNNGGLFRYSGKFWVKNIPSTIAFDSLLNQYYIDKKFGKGLFEVPTTHFWKSAQKRKNKDVGFIPMPLKKDNSEFRILEVSLGPSKLVTGENRISIQIDPNYLTESGFQMYSYLKRDRIKINWKSRNDQEEYREWPFTNNYQFQARSKLAAYSYWLSETLDNEKYCVLGYDNIREHFLAEKIGKIARDIIPFNKFEKSYFKKDTLKEVYYQYWTTLFLESYSINADLGTAMFLTSHQYDSSFLMKCSNWIRWIYNELRLLESSAYDEINDYMELSHRQKIHISGLRFWGEKKLGGIVGKLDYDIFKYFLSKITSFSRISNPQYELKLKEFNLTEKIKKNIEIFRTLHSDFKVFDYTFRLGLDKIAFDLYKDYSFVQVDLEKEVFAKGDIDNIDLLLKDILENFTIHSDRNNPKCKVRLIKESGYILFQCFNSKWPDEKVINNMKENNFAAKKIGWRSIKHIAKQHSWEVDLSDEQKGGEDFCITIKIPHK